jgi:N-acetylmuramic acid 6-phosphate etherase
VARYGLAMEPDVDPLVTEAIRPELIAIDLAPTEELVLAMNADDATVPQAVAAVAPAIAAAIDAVVERLRRGGRLVYVGAGTAGRIGVLDAAECGPTFNTTRVVAVLAGGLGSFVDEVQDAEDDADAGARDLAGLELSSDDAVVAISASGRTPYVLGAVAHARERGSATIALVCNADTALARAADRAIELVVGPEFIAGSTRLKAGTAQKLVVNMISTIAMVKLGKTYGNLMVDVRASNDKLRARSRRIVALATGASDDEIERALAATDGEVKNAILTLLTGVDGPTASRLLEDADGHLRAALAAAPR